MAIWHEVTVAGTGPVAVSAFHSFGRSSQRIPCLHLFYRLKSGSPLGNNCASCRHAYHNMNLRRCSPVHLVVTAVGCHSWRARDVWLACFSSRRARSCSPSWHCFCYSLLCIRAVCRRRLLRQYTVSYSTRRCAREQILT
jgi:hypothetical protein